MLSGGPGPSSRFLLELATAASYCRRMKRISCLLITLSLCATHAARSQDAATEERLNKLSGQIEDLIAAQREQKQRITALARELESVRVQSARPSANYAAAEDLKHLAEAVKEVDRK